MKALQLMFGTISQIDEQNVRVRVRLPTCDNLRTAWYREVIYLILLGIAGNSWDFLRLEAIF